MDIAKEIKSYLIFIFRILNFMYIRFIKTRFEVRGQETNKVSGYVSLKKSGKYIKVLPFD